MSDSPSSAPASTTTSTEGSEARELLRLALPLALSSAGNMMLGATDTAMVGRLDAVSMGGLALGNNVFFTIALFGMGVVAGMDPLVSQAIGASEPARARRILWQGIRLGFWISFPLMALIFVASYQLERFGIAHPTAEITRRFCVARMPNMFTFLITTPLRSYLQSAGSTRPMVVSSIVANVINVVLNVLLIYGDDGLHRLHLPGVGLPPLGVLGSALASVIASIGAFLVIARGVARVPVPDDPDRRKIDPETIRKIARLGAPIGFQILCEAGAFSVVTQLAGRMGDLPLASQGISLTLISFTFTITLGVATATGTRVGKAVGRGDRAGARRSGLLGLGLSTVIMSLASLSFVFAPRPVLRLLTDKPEVVAASVPLLAVAAIFQVFDGAQVVMVNALRGAGDTKFPQYVNLVGFYAIGIPIAVALGVFADLGVVGLWWGLCAGLMAVSIALTLRFLNLSSRPIARA